MKLVELQQAFRSSPQIGQPWPWERRLLQLIMKSEEGIDPFKVIKAVIDNPDRVSRILPFLRDADIHRIRSLAATIQASNENLCMTVDLLNVWTSRQTIKKMLGKAYQSKIGENQKRSD